MRRTRLNKLRLKIASLAVAGICFQNVQCAVDTDTLALQFMESVATVLVTSFVNDTFGVPGFSTGF